MVANFHNMCQKHSFLRLRGIFVLSYEAKEKIPVFIIAFPLNYSKFGDSSLPATVHGLLGSSNGASCLILSEKILAIVYIVSKKLPERFWFLSLLESDSWFSNPSVRWKRFDSREKGVDCTYKTFACQSCCTFVLKFGNEIKILVSCRSDICMTMIMDMFWTSWISLLSRSHIHISWLVLLTEKAIIRLYNQFWFLWCLWEPNSRWPFHHRWR